jgi:hypothetical protein
MFICVYLCILALLKIAWSILRRQTSHLWGVSITTEYLDDMRRPRRWRIGLRTSQEEAKHKVCGLDGWETSVETAGAMDMEDNGEDVEHVRQWLCHHGRRHGGARAAAKLEEGGLEVGREQLRPRRPRAASCVGAYLVRAAVLHRMREVGQFWLSSLLRCVLHHCFA